MGEAQTQNTPWLRYPRIDTKWLLLLAVRLNQTTTYESPPGTRGQEINTDTPRSCTTTPPRVEVTSTHAHSMTMTDFGKESLEAQVAIVKKFAFGSWMLANVR